MPRQLALVDTLINVFVAHRVALTVERDHRLVVIWLAETDLHTSAQLLAELVKRQLLEDTRADQEIMPSKEST